MIDDNGRNFITNSVPQLKTIGQNITLNAFGVNLFKLCTKVLSSDEEWF